MLDIKTLDIEALRQVPLFAQLPQQQLQWLAELGTEIWLQSGEQIARQGDPPNGFYIILEGQTEWTRGADLQDGRNSAYIHK